jgi:hypothetical protein
MVHIVETGDIKSPKFAEKKYAVENYPERPH